MSQYLRLYVGDISLLLHYQQVLEVGDWHASERERKEASWREQLLPLLSLAKLFNVTSNGNGDDVFVVVESNHQRTMLLAHRIDSLVDVEDYALQPVLDAELAASALVDMAWYRDQDDCVYWRLCPDRIDLGRLEAEVAS